MYEYTTTQLEVRGKSESVPGFQFAVPYTHESMEDVLGRMGGQGWRLASGVPLVFPGGGASVVLVWEREKK